MRKLKGILILLVLTLTLTACNLPGLGANVSQNDVVVAGGSTSERQILSEMNVQMINHYHPEIKTDLITNLGSSLLIIQTMMGGDTNISATMYTGTALVGELNQEPITDPELALSKVVEGYYEKYDIMWMPSYGFENTYAFMVKKDFAKEHNIEKISDLESMADDLLAGVDTGWMDRKGDGYRDFKRIYGFDFGTVLPMQIGLVYDAVAAGEMDIVLGYSSDGRIQANDLIIIEDDLNLFPPYNGSPVVTMTLLEEHPELIDIFLRLEGEVDTETMQELNRKSDEDKIEGKVIAKDFLEKNNFFENKVIKPLDDRADYVEMMKDLKNRISEAKDK